MRDKQTKEQKQKPHSLWDSFAWLGVDRMQSKNKLDAKSSLALRVSFPLTLETTKGIQIVETRNKRLVKRFLLSLQKKTNDKLNQKPCAIAMPFAWETIDASQGFVFSLCFVVLFNIHAISTH